MKSLLLSLACSLLLSAPAVASPQVAKPAAVELKAADPVEMTRDQAYSILVMETGLTPEEAVYVLTNTDQFRSLLYYIAQAKGMLPYQG